jgi:tRNA A-37 threonylcarbamoyl transferase component Bud32
MGTVFLAEHALIKRRVAIKVLHPELATNADVIERFMNEARAAGTLGHPNIVESTDMGFAHDRVPYIVFEYLEGALLTDEIYRVGGFTVRRAVRIAQQIASALHAAHVAGIVHRDLKSDNVFLTDKDDALDHVKVLDFGISRFLSNEEAATARGMVMGTPEFMAPEQITAPDKIDRRADIYALGVIMYEMLTARRPFSNDDDPRALLSRIVHNPPPPLGREDVPHGLAELVLTRMLAKDPAERYPTMIDVEAALAAFGTQSELGGLRRARPTLTPVMMSVSADAVAKLTNEPAAPIVPATSNVPAAKPAPRLDTDDQTAAVSLPSVGAVRRPWWLYGVAGVGLAVGIAGLVVGLRGGDEPAPQAQVASAAEPAAGAPTQVAIPTPPPATKIAVHVEANVAGAHVTFRRRILDLPATLDLNTSDIVEVVEVFATGYKTERYWLTLDRMTHLTAKLTKGDGLAEATETETLVALGEAAEPTATPDPTNLPAPAPPAAPEPAVTATAAPAVTAPLAKKPAAKIATRRRIGRGAAPPPPAPGTLSAKAPAVTAGKPIEPTVDRTAPPFGGAAGRGQAPTVDAVSAAADGGAKKASPGSVDGIDAVSAGVADGAKKPAKPPAPAPVGKLAPASTRATAVDGIDAVTSGVADGAKKPAGKPDPSAPDAVSTGHE